MEATAHVRYARISPRKVDQILMLVRGKSVARALTVLQFVNKSSRPLVEKTLQSALANAGRNLSPESWYVARAWVGLGPVFKRMRAHAMGRAALDVSLHPQDTRSKAVLLRHDSLGM